MQRHISSFTKRSLFLGVGIVLFASLTACSSQWGLRNTDVTAKTTYSGIVNGSPMKVDVLATIDTGRGGSSTCTFVNLPTGFNPAFLGTHA